MNAAYHSHIAVALRHASPGMTVTGIPRVDICTGTGLQEKAPCLYRSMACFILQGAKRVAINDKLLSYDSDQYLISALDLPLTGEIRDAEDGQPYIAVSLELDPAILADVMSSMPQVSESHPDGMGIALNPVTPQLREALLRLLLLLDTPEDILVIGPMVERELLYRLLQGPQGRLLRQIARPEGTLNRIRDAVSWIRDNYNTALSISTLCDLSGMSKASLHRHFLTITGLSPIQYQKQLRLQEARHLLLAGDRRVSDVAFFVGYESASQFSREYVRQFGASPGRDMLHLRQVFND